MSFLWIKAFHIVAMVTWIGGMLMLCLLLGTLSRAPVLRLPQERRLMFMVRRWDRTITTPAMVLTWILGLAMALQTGWLAMPWLQVKLSLALALAASHGMLAGKLRQMTGDAASPPWVGLRFAAGATMATTALIAVLVVLKPF